MASADWRLRLEAADRFYALRRRAKLAEWWAALTRRCNDLLRFDEHIGPRHRQQWVDGGYREVPIRAIVGSVGRAHDFTRSFLPRTSAEVERWIRLYSALQGIEGFPEVELIEVDGQYFVDDGHHRISVARAAGLTEIPAHVIRMVRAPSAAPAAAPPVVCCARC